MTDTTVKFFHSAMTGAPVLNGVAGSTIGILDACLVTGFASVTLDSIVITGGVAVCTRAAGHSFEVGSVALIASATTSGGSINGEQKVTAATSTTFSFATALGNQTATGTITAKLAPAGWAKTYSGTNLAAYKSTDITSTGCLLRVDNTGTVAARVVGYETMSDVNTGTGVFPTNTQQSGGFYWQQSSTANATANPWILIADGRMFYFARAHRGGNNSSNITDYDLHVFGDVLPTKSGDPFACIIDGELTDQTGQAMNNSGNSYYTNQSAASGSSIYFPRSYTALGAPVIGSRCFPTLHNANITGVSGNPVSTNMPFPNPTDGGMYVVPHYLFEKANIALRAISPGFYCSMQNIPFGAFLPRDSVTGVVSLPGKTLKAVTNTNSSSGGVCFFDITGPWR